MTAPHLTLADPLAGRIGRSASPGRQAVEKVLIAARGTPLPIRIIASRCGIQAEDARMHVANCVAKGAAHNVAPGAQNGLYVWGPQPAPARPPEAATPRRLVTVDHDPHYHGAELRPFTGRPGAMDAFGFPSLVNGVAVPRVRPVIISAQPELKR